MSNRYLTYLSSDKWRQKSKFFRSIMLNRCCVLPFLKSNDAHHMTYKNLEREVFWRDVVPLSDFIHDGIVHPIARLIFLKHDNHTIRFFINWLLLRPSCLFWFVALTALNLLSKIIGRKAIAIASLFFAIGFGCESIINLKVRVVYGALCFVFTNLYCVFKGKR